jgi:hypothetical protein
VAIVADDKNWTWVLEKPCSECGFGAGSIDVRQMGPLVRANANAWPDLLAQADARKRPVDADGSDAQWSALEYGCHVRDVFRIYDERLRLMLETDRAEFADWDQGVTAVADRYDEQDPAIVASELVAAGESSAQRWHSVRDDQWNRPGYRSDGAEFTVESLARYLLHDPVHHLNDVRAGYFELNF